MKFNFPMTLYVLFCKDLMVNIENSLVKTFMLFPKYVTFTVCAVGTGKYLKIVRNQLLQLCTARTAWSDSVIRSETSSITESDRSGPIR